MMRITQNMLIRSNLSYISNNYERHGEIQDQMQTGKKITRPSQDPVIAMKGMRYRSQVVEVEQFQRNLNEAYSWMDNAEGALDKTTNILQRVKELVVQASNDSYSTDDRQASAAELKQLQEHVASLANTKVGNNYIFNGTNTASQPVNLEHLNKQISDVAENAQDMVLTHEGKQFTYDSESSDPPNFIYTNGNEQITVDTNAQTMTYDTVPASNAVALTLEDVIISQKDAVSTNQQNFEIEVMKGISLPVNSRPQNVYSADLFNDMSKLISTLEDSTKSATEVSEYLDKFDAHLNNITQERAELGARYNRLELVDERLSQQEIIAKQTMSENEDIDFEKVIIDLTTQESLHRASLAAGARIIQPTLMDFLR